MSSSWDINWDLNSSRRRTTQQLYAGRTLPPTNGVVETSDDSAVVNEHRNTWSLGTGLDLQRVDTTWVNRSLGMENDAHTTVDTIRAPVFATPYQVTATSTSIQVAPPSAPTDTSTYGSATSPSTGMSSPVYVQASAGTSPSISTSPGASTTPTEPPPYTVSFLEGVKSYCCSCGYETTRKTDMRRHRESSKHSQQKYICPFCDKGYTRKYNLEQHEEKNHR